VESSASRPRRLLACLWRHPWRSAALVLLVCFLLLNFLAYQHAHAMLTFSDETARTPPPQSLSTGQKLKVLTCGVTVPRPENTRSPENLGLPFETIHFAGDDGTNLEGWLLAPPNPKGTILLFHGYASSRSSLLEEARAFYEMGYAAVLIDLRGSGGSDGSATTLGYDEAQDVAATVRYARSRSLPGPLILYGQSMGGAAVLRSVAALEVKPDGVILESVFGRMLGAVRNRFGLMGVPSFPAAELLVFWGGVQMGFSGFSHNPEEYARSCDCAALVLHGAEDRHARPEEGEAIYKNLTGNKERVVFEGAGHTSLHGADPEKWKAVVESFLATKPKREP
jgi:alpha-beta hydrolase superfamily lysophospholipase